MAEPTQEDIRAGYGFVALLGNAVPEINSILNQAVKDKWTPDRFVMTVANTSWWRTKPAAERDWVIKYVTDPAQAEREIWAGADSIRNLSVQLGVPMPSVEKAKDIWLATKWGGLDETN